MSSDSVVRADGFVGRRVDVDRQLGRSAGGAREVSERVLENLRRGFDDKLVMDMPRPAPSYGK